MGFTEVSYGLCRSSGIIVELVPICLEVTNYHLKMTTVFKRHNARVVPLDGRPFPTADIKLWSGAARGHWENDTLIVQTSNFSDKTAVFQMPAISIADAAGSGAVGSSIGFTLTERFTRQGQTLLYSYTINAPEVFTKPFTVEVPLQKSEARMYEYACHEGNYALPAMLRGARLLEAEALSRSE